MKKRRFVLLPALLALPLFFAGCESDSSTSLEGTWVAASLTVEDGNGNTQSADLPDNWNEELTLNPDGSFSYHATKDGRASSGHGDWDNENHNLQFRDGSNGELRYDISGNTLTISGTIPEGDFKLRWKKK